MVRLYACGVGALRTSETAGLLIRSTFVPVAFPAGVTNWLKVYPGRLHVLAIAGNGALYSWGNGSSGQLGSGGTANSLVPQLFALPSGVSNWLALAAGYNHSSVSQTTGTCIAGALVRLVNSDREHRPAQCQGWPTPTNVVAWKAIGAGINHSLGIADNCVLYGWGANNFGQLGIGSLINQTNEQAVQTVGDLLRFARLHLDHHAPSFAKGSDILFPKTPAFR